MLHSFYPHHHLPPSLEGRGIQISAILQNDFNIFFGEGASWERGSQFLEGDSRFLEIDSNYRFYFRLLLDLLLTRKLKDVISPAIFHLCSQLISFYFKVFVTLFYFINGLSSRKSLQRSTQKTQKSIKISKISYFLLF